MGYFSHPTPYTLGVWHELERHDDGILRLTPHTLYQQLGGVLLRWGISHTLHPTVEYCVQPTPYTVHELERHDDGIELPVPNFLHPTPCTLHLAPHSLHSAPYTLHLAPPS